MAGSVLSRTSLLKKAPSSALSQTRILMMVRILRYTRICTLALLLQMYMSSISICILPSVVNASTLVLSMFFNVYFFFLVNCNWRTHKKKPHCIKFENATTKSNNFNLSPVIVFTHMSLRLHKFMKERLN